VNTSATLTPTATKDAPFNPNLSTDRCDAGTKNGTSCNAQAWARAVLPNGLKLLFCGHHLHQHRDGPRGLVEQGAVIEDYTDQIPQ
jgi:hypothetical protein